MSEKVVKLEKEDFTPENIRRAFHSVCMKQIRAACQQVVYDGLYNAYLEREKEYKDAGNDANEEHTCE